MKNYITEFIGTFFLVLVIGLASAHAGALAPLAIGSVLMVMVYMGGPVSGAHYNPAVTLAILLRKKIETKEALVYMIVQVLGALAAALLFCSVSGKAMGAPAPSPELKSSMSAVLLEAVFTFALASVVLNVATSKKSAGNSYFGLAIGFTVMASAFSVGSLTGGAFNPAVAAGPSIADAMMGGSAINNLWIYLVGPFAGAIVAALIYRVMNPDEFQG